MSTNKIRKNIRSIQKREQKGDKMDFVIVKPVLSIIYDNCVADILKSNGLISPKLERNFSISKRTSLEKLSLTSAWASAFIGITLLLAHIGEVKNIFSINRLLFSEFWADKFKHRLKKINKNIKKRMKKTKEESSQSPFDHSNSGMWDYEHDMFVKEQYNQVINTEVEFDIVQPDDEEFHTFFEKFMKMKIKAERIFNFCINLVWRGLNYYIEAHKKQQFEENLIKYSIQEFSITEKVILIYETESKDKDKSLKKKFKEAKELCEVTLYSYLLLTSLKYPILDLQSFQTRNFKSAVGVLCDVSESADLFTLPIVHPKLVFSMKRSKSHG